MCTIIIACLISLSALSLSSCTQKTVATSVVYTDFPQTIELKAKVQPLDTALFRYPFRIRIQGDKAVVMDLHGTDYFCHAFSYPEFHYISSFGKRGESPDEQISVENIRWYGESLWSLDANKSELTRFGCDLSGDSLFRQEAVNLDKDILRALDFVMVDDSTFIIPDYSGDNRFCRVNRQGGLLYKMGAILSSNEDAMKHARPALAQAWRSFIFMLRAVCRPVLSAFLLHASICALSLRSSRSDDGVALQPCKVMKKSCSAFRLSGTSPSLKNSVMRASSSSDVWPS